MINNAAEKFLVLIQHPVKHRFVVSEQVKNAGLIGSILLDLANSENLEIENGKLLVKSRNTGLSQAHAMILEEIGKSSRIRKIKTWILKFSRKPSKIQKELSLSLESKGVIKIHQKSFLGIKYFKTGLINSEIRKSIIKETGTNSIHIHSPSLE
ncbi:MAG: GPP34 family phosphoprotein [Bacteroidales bacterium]|nr:GPP34 family phosphoprotein [Bacteroidales bacterium]